MKIFVFCLLLAAACLVQGQKNKKKLIEHCKRGLDKCDGRFGGEPKRYVIEKLAPDLPDWEKDILADVKDKNDKGACDMLREKCKEVGVTK